jgi:hypothetical protein
MNTLDLVVLKCSEKAAEMVQRGEAYRDGGVIRHNASGRIVEFLTDGGPLDRAEEAKDGTIVVQPHALPMALDAFGTAEVCRRLERIEHQLELVADHLRDVSTSVELANVKLDASLVGKMIGTFRACALDLPVAGPNELRAYRRKFVEYHEQMSSVVGSMLARPELLRHSPSVAAQYVDAMLLSGVAAFYLSTEIGDEVGALDVLNRLQLAASRADENASRELNSLRSLFWRGAEHLAVLKQLREGRARTSSYLLAQEHRKGIAAELADLTKSRELAHV